MTSMNISNLNPKAESWLAEDILEYIYESFGEQLTFACSFGLEDMAILELLRLLSLDIDIFYLDTGRLPPETYDLIERSEYRYGKIFRPIYPEASDVSSYVQQYGINGFFQSKESRLACCEARKVLPLKRSLTGKKAWITGIRKDQSPNRSTINVFEIDDDQRVKVNPLLNWTWQKTWNFIKANKVPYNQLHDRSFPSIGCQPCTRAVQKGEGFRAGRWWWEQNSSKECGLHQRRNKSW